MGEGRVLPCLVMLSNDAQCSYAGTWCGLCGGTVWGIIASRVRAVYLYKVYDVVCAGKMLEYLVMLHKLLCFVHISN